MEHIRNFCIIAHIDHGKSTLADRFLEITGAVDTRRMHEQYLDQLELERERGITIKMAPVRMRYELGQERYELNLIDTPGHSDFSYEVSRALAAVEGGILLVDATQGIQAQTLANLHSARKAGLTVVGAVNKIDVLEGNGDEEGLDRVRGEVAELLNAGKEEVLMVSAKTGKGTRELLEAVVRRVPPPGETAQSGIQGRETPARALIFDSFYDDHKGVIASVRVFGGIIQSTDTVTLAASGASSKIKEIGCFAPALTPTETLNAGEIGYIATGIKDIALVKIGDTAISSKFKVQNPRPLALHGYREPQPVVFVSFYPENNDDYDLLKRSFDKLRLNDSSLSIEPDQNEVLGRGFKVGFLGHLHFEITAERLRREFKVRTVSTFPSVLYKVKTKKGWQTIVKPEELPEEHEEIMEPMVQIVILTSPEFLNNIYPLQKRFRFMESTTETFQNQTEIKAKMPLAELVSDFDDQLKSATAGYASFSYELADYRKADIERVDVAVAGELIPGLSRFFPKETVQYEARQLVERLKKTLPQQQFPQPIQAKVGAKIIAREDIPAMRKELGNFGKNGGDRTRKMKLWQKQKKGKERLKARAHVRIPPHLFKELLKK